MPVLHYEPTDAQAARIVAATRETPDKDGHTPPLNATNAQLWAHAKRVHLMLLINHVRMVEAMQPDDLSSIVST